VKWNEIIKRSKDMLLVEDSKKRIESTKLKSLDWFDIARDEKCFEYYLLNKNYKTLWLDYDLTRIWKLKDRQNSYSIIKKYKNYFKNSHIELIVIHSWNPLGAIKLYLALRGLGIKIVVKRHWIIL
jgi:hypothetical protein